MDGGSLKVNMETALKSFSQHLNMKGQVCLVILPKEQVLILRVRNNVLCRVVTGRVNGVHSLKVIAVDPGLS